MYMCNHVEAVDLYPLMTVHFVSMSTRVLTSFPALHPATHDLHDPWTHIKVQGLTVQHALTGEGLGDEVT